MTANIFVASIDQSPENTGEWFNLCDYKTKEEFLKAFRSSFAGKDYSEFFISKKDYILYGMQEQWMTEKGIHENVFQFLQAFKDNNDDNKEATVFLQFVNDLGLVNADFETLKQYFDEYFIGFFDSEIEYAVEVAEQRNYYEALEQAGIPNHYFDIKAFSDDLFMNDYKYYHLNGAVFTKFII